MPCRQTVGALFRFNDCGYGSSQGRRPRHQDRFSGNKMSGTFLKWGIPALLTVVGGTTAAVLTSGAAIPTDLAIQAHAQLAAPDYSWAALSFDAQDATLSGTATTQQMIDDVTVKVSAIHGVRTVTSNVVLAEYVSPF